MEMDEVKKAILQIGEVEKLAKKAGQEYIKIANGGSDYGYHVTSLAFDFNGEKFTFGYRHYDGVATDALVTLPLSCLFDYSSFAQRHKDECARRMKEIEDNTCKSCGHRKDLFMLSMGANTSYNGTKVML